MHFILVLTAIYCSRISFCLFNSWINERLNKDLKLQEVTLHIFIFSTLL